MARPMGIKFTEEQKAKLRGRIPWNKGMTMSDPRVKRSVEAAHRAHRGQAPWNKGGHHSLEANEKNRLAHLGKGIGNTYRSGLAPWNKGKILPHQSEELRTRRSEIAKRRVAMGLHNNYKGGITPMQTAFRHSLLYETWRRKVFNRDDHRCLDCGDRGVYLHAHHIYSFAQFPRLRLMVENGQTLCKPCHHKRPKMAAVSK